MTPDDHGLRITVSHEAMATAFQVTVVHDEAAYARQAAEAALAELDLIESRLSRFQQGSDIFRVNHLGCGEEAIVSLEAFECLRIASQMRDATEGAFDVAFATAAVHRGGLPFELIESARAVRALVAPVDIDLGAIGKGFALDRMAAVLAEWDIDSALLCASTSTILALAAPPGAAGWRVAFGPDDALKHVHLSHAAWSTSGRAVKGAHIVDPRTGRSASDWCRTWSGARSTAVADALSTACMVMSRDAVSAYCRRNPEAAAFLLPAETGPLVEISAGLLKGRVE